MQTLFAPGECMKAPVYACIVDFDGNFRIPKLCKALYAAGLRVYTASAKHKVNMHSKKTCFQLTHPYCNHVPPVTTTITEPYNIIKIIIIQYE